MKANAVNLASFANALCHLNTTPLSVAVLAPCAWGGNLACGVAWRSVLNSATHNTAWRSEFGNETAKRGKFQWHSTANSVWRNGRCLRAKRKCGSVWVGDFSLVARTFWHTFGLNLKGFFTHFVVVSSYLVANFSYFIVVFSRLFAYKKHFLGHYAFLKFLNALFLGFLRLSLRAVFAKTANLALFLLFGLPRSLCSLAMTDKENTLCHLARTADFVILSVAKNPHFNKV